VLFLQAKGHIAKNKTINTKNGIELNNINAKGENIEIMFIFVS